MFYSFSKYVPISAKFAGITVLLRKIFLVHRVPRRWRAALPEFSALACDFREDNDLFCSAILDYIWTISLIYLAFSRPYFTVRIPDLFWHSFKLLLVTDIDSFEFYERFYVSRHSHVEKQNGGWLRCHFNEA